MSETTKTALSTRLRDWEEEDDEIDLGDMFRFCMSRLPLLILAVLIGAGAAFGITRFFIPSKYTATSKMYMVSASSDAVVNLSDLNIGTSLSNDYVELMKSRPVLEDVIDKLELDYTYESLLNMISLSVVSNTRIVRISVTSTDPAEAMNIANQLARTAKVQLPKVMEAPAPTIVENAVLPTHRSSPSMVQNVAIGAGAMLILMLGILVILYLHDDTLKTSEDVEKEFGILPLAVIPEGEIKGLEESREKKRLGDGSRHRHKGDEA